LGQKGFAARAAGPSKISSMKAGFLKRSAALIGSTEDDHS